MGCMLHSRGEMGWGNKGREMGCMLHSRGAMGWGNRAEKWVVCFILGERWVGAIRAETWLYASF